MSSPVATPVTVDAARAGRTTLAVAWVGTLALSRLLHIILVDVLGIDASLMTWIWLVLAMLLVSVAWIWAPARPLRGYFIVMMAVIVAAFVLAPWLQGLGVVQAGSDIVRNANEKAVLAAVALAMAAFLLVVLRQRPADVFLTAGNLQAPSALRLPGMHQPLSWVAVGTIATTVLPAVGAGQMWLVGALPGPGFDRLAPLASLILATAVCNAFGEEILFRVGPLAFLSRVVGANQAVLMTSVWFGLGHYSGSGMAGPLLAVWSGAVALLLGRAMIATRGLGWPLIIHTAIDVVIFSTIAAAAS